MAIERKITYFDAPGEENTAAVLNIARERAKELGIRQILIPSVRGASAEKALDFFATDQLTLFFVGYRSIAFFARNQKAH